MSMKYSDIFHTAPTASVFFILFKNFCPQNSRAFEIAAFHSRNYFIHGSVFD